jgi:hypothetical protein
MAPAGHAVLALVGGLIHKVKAQELAGYTPVPAGEAFPEEHERILRQQVPPQVVLLEVVAICTKAGSAMQVQREMKTARSAGLPILIDRLKYRLVRVKVVPVCGPKPIIERNADKVKAELCQKVKRFFVHRSGHLLRLPGTHPLEIEAVMLLFVHMGIHKSITPDGDAKFCQRSCYLTSFLILGLQKGFWKKKADLTGEISPTVSGYPLS